ncbi:MAG: SlyX family protein [Methylococcaceae bacterium]|nr:SlyX family protein [Methylococcaceae bacterium]
MDEKRLVELEIKLAYQEDLLQSLNMVVCDQQKQIARLEETCKLLNERIKNRVEPQSINQGVEIPPHY